MCLFIALLDCVPGCPLVIGANREEFYNRPSAAPARIQDHPSVWGGRDLRQGGTWLGVNEHGLVVAVTNRPGALRPKARSRGLLCLDVLASSSVEDALQSTQKATETAEFNPFNLFAGDGSEGFVVSHEHKNTITCLDPGLCLIPNGEVNDLHTPRVRRTQSLLADLSLSGPDQAVTALQKVLSDHESGVPFRDMICVHGTESGTVSSSILAIWPDRIEQSRYMHLQGKPCETTYKDYSFLFRE
jgi:uncharacterized protein with NRDE domain